MNTGDIVGVQSNGGTGTGFCMFIYTQQDGLPISTVASSWVTPTGIFFIYSYGGKMILVTDGPYGPDGFYAHYNEIFGLE
jgi:hypothetical protein